MLASRLLGILLYMKATGYVPVYRVAARGVA